MLAFGRWDLGGRTKRKKRKKKAKAVNGKVLVEIWKGMYRLKQAGHIANDRLKQHLKASGYVPCRYTPGIFTHISRKTSLALCVDEFGVKYTDSPALQM